MKKTKEEIMDEIYKNWLKWANNVIDVKEWETNNRQLEQQLEKASGR